VDSGLDYFKKCLALFDGDFVALSTQYYADFCEYILARKPDIIGHFDLVTKYLEVEPSILTDAEKYAAVAEKYIALAAEANCLFEVNTGAITRGLRTTPYPAENLLRILKKKGAGLVLNADSHAKDTLDFAFDEAKKLLMKVGFTHTFVLYNGRFEKVPL
jgi:histidinol-phosphatase (PHP family)